MEQPRIVKNIISRRLKDKQIVFPDLNLKNDYLAKVSRIIIQAAGTSWHAGLVGKFFIEEFARVHTKVDISSEFRYRNPVIEGDILLIAISQSGETADTIAGVREAKSKFIKVLAICNNIESTIARESDAVMLVTNRLPGKTLWDMRENISFLFFYSLRCFFTYTLSNSSARISIHIVSYFFPPIILSCLLLPIILKPHFS